MKLKEKRKLIENLTIESAAAEGRCVARSDGQVIFVNGAAPGDVVDVRVTKWKKSHLEAIPIHFHKKSDQRVEPFCYHFGTCGGCRWQHLDYKAQLEFKQQQVLDQFQRIGKLKISKVSPIIPSGKTTLYRNKLEFTFTPKRWLSHEEIQSGQELERKGLGFHAPGRFDKILDIEQCYLQPEPSNELRLFVKFFAINNGLSFYDISENRGFLRNLIIRTTSTGEVMVILQVGEDRPEQIELICSKIQESFPEVTSLNYVVNTKKNEIFYDLPVINYSGRHFIMEQLGDIKLQIGPKSFFQTNANQALELYRLVKKLARLTEKEIVYDLYTGIGSIANFVADSARKVVGIDNIAAAIDDAKVNSAVNGHDNTHFVAGDMQDVLTEEFVESQGEPDVIITDPPRAGMHQDVLQSIIRMSPDRIVYISCNPATQARDLEFLSEHYTTRVVQPIDMFPHTHHVENVVLLEKRK